MELKRILHVEDDPSIQAVTRLALEMVGGFEVLSCSSGPQALAQVDAFAPDLILLDVMMPGMDGRRHSPACANTRRSPTCRWPS